MVAPEYIIPLINTFVAAASETEAKPRLKR